MLLNVVPVPFGWPKTRETCVREERPSRNEGVIIAHDVNADGPLSCLVAEAVVAEAKLLSDAVRTYCRTVWKKLIPFFLWC